MYHDRYYSPQEIEWEKRKMKERARRDTRTPEEKQRDEDREMFIMSMLVVFGLGGLMVCAWRSGDFSRNVTPHTVGEFVFMAFYVFGYFSACLYLIMTVCSCVAKLYRRFSRSIRHDSN
jgi:hypothetical protein